MTSSNFWSHWLKLNVNCLTKVWKPLLKWPQMTTKHREYLISSVPSDLIIQLAVGEDFVLILTCNLVRWKKVMTVFEIVFSLCEGVGELETTVQIRCFIENHISSIFYRCLKTVWLCHTEIVQETRIITKYGHEVYFILTLIVHLLLTITYDYNQWVSKRIYLHFAQILIKIIYSIKGWSFFRLGTNFFCFRYSFF